VGTGEALVGLLESGGRDGVGPPPDLDLVLAVLGSGLSLVQALEGTVVPLVQAPALVLGDPLSKRRGSLDDVKIRAHKNVG
jgi:hypothetical protein